MDPREPGEQRWWRRETEWQRAGGRRRRERVGQEVKAYMHLTGKGVAKGRWEKEKGKQEVKAYIQLTGKGVEKGRWEKDKGKGRARPTYTLRVKYVLQLTIASRSSPMLCF